jgi:hypothetical protein
MPLIGGGVSVMYSYPNYIGLSPDEMYGVWKAAKELDFDWMYGGWYQLPVIKQAKPTILKSLQQITQIITKANTHPIFAESMQL